MQLTNKIFLVSLLLLVFSLFLVSAINHRDDEDYWNLKKRLSHLLIECKKDCLKEKKESYRQCIDDFKSSLHECKETLKSCEDNAKKMEEKEERERLLKECISNYVLCIKDSKHDLLDCKKEAKDAFLVCIRECKENLCESDADCDGNEFCEESSCNKNFGQCQIKPVLCLTIFDPVCGCDGQTYGNDCEREKAGVSLDHTGTCV